MPRVNEILDCSILNNLRVMLCANSKPDVMKYNLPLWFLPCLFSVLMIVLLLESVYEKLIIPPRKNGDKSFNIWHVGTILIFVAAGFVCSNYLYFPLPWHFETAVSMVVWFELGYLLKNNEKIINRLTTSTNLSVFIIIVLFVTGVTACIINRYVFNASLEVRLDLYGCYPLYYLSAIGSISGIMFLSIKIVNNQCLEYIGLNSLFILVMHKFPVLFFQELLPFTKNILQDSNSLSGILCGLVVTAISVAISLGIGIFIKRICPFLIGDFSNKHKKNK